MTKYIIGRLIGAIPVLILVSIATFVAIRIAPGDLAAIRLGDRATAEDIAELRAIMGLDRPIYVQYLHWIGDLLRGDFGDSLQGSGEPVGQRLWQRLPVTLELAALSLVFASVLGLTLGIISAVRNRTPVDHVIRVVAVLGQAVPNFWLAIMILTFTSIYFGWVPPFAYRAPWVDPWHNFQQFMLPTLVLGYTLSALTMRLTRSTMLETLGQDYIRTARAKGLAESTVVMRHALKNSMIPVITIIGSQMRSLIGGTVIIEAVFSLPGVGRQTLEAIVQRDYTQLQFNVLVIAAFVVLVNLVVDLTYGYMDPRIRLGGGGSGSR